MTSSSDELLCGPGPSDQAILRALIPIAVVIAAGCEPCAEKMVRRALKEGASRALVLKTIAIVEGVHGSECFRAAVGQELCERMLRPLARARRTVAEEPAGATAPAGSSCC